MNILKAYKGMASLLQQAARGAGEQDFHPELFNQLRFCDELLQLMAQDPAVPHEVRIEVYTTLLSSGPGGLLAFVWLIRAGYVSHRLLEGYIHCLQSGAPSEQALEERAACEVAEMLFTYKLLDQDQQLQFAARLLTCSGIARPARMALLKRLLGGLWIDDAARYPLALWSTEAPGCQARPALAQAPAPGEELFRVGIMGRAQMGEDIAILLQAYSAEEGGETPAHQAEGMLDLLELYGEDLPDEQTHAFLERLRQHSEARIRRRAYQLGENYAGETFLRLGLRDLDAGVRSWVLARVSSGRAGESSKPARRSLPARSA